MKTFSWLLFLALAGMILTGCTVSDGAVKKKDVHILWAPGEPQIVSSTHNPSLPPGLGRIVCVPSPTVPPDNLGTTWTVRGEPSPKPLPGATKPTLPTHKDVTFTSTTMGTTWKALNVPIEAQKDTTVKVVFIPTSPKP